MIIVSFDPLLDCIHVVKGNSNIKCIYIYHLYII